MDDASLKCLANQTPLLSLTDAGFYRQGQWLVRGVSFTLKRGEIITLIGPNGAGKTTTLKLALGIIKPSEGKAWKSDRISIGYVPQSFAVDRQLPLTLGRFLSLTRAYDEATMLKSLAQVGLSLSLEHELSSLSGGELQRLLLARAIIHKPDLLVLDEPVQGVDHRGEVALYQLISDLRRELSCAILLISHDLHHVMAATDLVICLNRHICCQGHPSQIEANEDYRHLFGLSPQSALPVANYEHHHDHIHLTDGRVQHDNGSIHEPACHHHDHSHDHSHHHPHD